MDALGGICIVISHIALIVLKLKQCYGLVHLLFLDAIASLALHFIIHTELLVRWCEL